MDEIREQVRSFWHPLLKDAPPRAVRRAFESFAGRPTPGLDVREVDLMRDLAVDDPDYHNEDALFLEAEWIVPSNASPRHRLVYLHGGGYIAGSPQTHRGLVARIAKAMGYVALVPAYRLGPEFPFPAAVEDANLALQRAFVEGPEGESPAARVVLVGDSAGGGLALSTALYARDHGLCLPQRIGTLSAWTDLTLSGPSLRELDGIDPMIPASVLPRWVADYLGSADARDGYASPLFAELHDLPPITMQAGEFELLRDDTVRFAERARASGVSVDFEIYPHAFHVFQSFAGVIPEGREAITKLARTLAQDD